MNSIPPIKPLRWIASSRKDFADFPPKVQETFGFELFLAQSSLKAPSAKLLKGFGSGVVELIEDYDGDTYRAVYTVHFKHAVYVLHCFKKKSKQGIATPQIDKERIKKRLQDAHNDHSNLIGKE